jgi:uncharacterized protein (TIGR02246 family)
MRRALFLLAAVAAACSPKTETPATDTSGAPAASATHDESADRAAIDSIRSAWGAAAERKDAATVAGMYTDDAVVLEAESPIASGRDAIQKAFAEAFPISSNLKINSDKLEVSGDLAYDYGTFSRHVAPPGAKAMDMKGNYLVVLRREGGGWKIVRQMSYIPPAG